jgi:hypothetical protein
MRDLVIRVRMADTDSTLPLDLAIRLAMLGDHTALQTLLSSWSVKVEEQVVGSTVTSEQPEGEVSLVLGVSCAQGVAASVLAGLDKNGTLWVLHEWAGPSELFPEGVGSMLAAEDLTLSHLQWATCPPRHGHRQTEASELASRLLKDQGAVVRSASPGMFANAWRWLEQMVDGGRLKVAPACTHLIAGLNGSSDASARMVRDALKTTGQMLSDFRREPVLTACRSF